jgi:hypothetical protein
MISSETQKSACTEHTTMSSKPQHTYSDHHRLPVLLLLMASAQLASAFSTSRSPGTSFYTAQTRRTPISTRLLYRDGDELDIEMREQDKTTSTNAWWNPFAATALKSQTATSDVDEYLEFLERRYQRLHEDQGRTEVKFSALKWLKQEDGELNQQQHENVLYALGVAGLASERLLHKHQPHQLKSYEPAAVDVQVVKTASTKPQAPVLATLVAARLSPAFRKLMLQRKLLIRYQSLKLKAFATMLLKAAINMPVKASKSLLKMSGGKRNLIYTASLMATVFVVLLRPVVQTIVSEGRA